MSKSNNTTRNIYINEQGNIEIKMEFLEYLNNMLGEILENYDEVEKELKRIQPYINANTYDLYEKLRELQCNIQINYIYYCNVNPNGLPKKLLEEREEILNNNKK